MRLRTSQIGTLVLILLQVLSGELFAAAAPAQQAVLNPAEVRWRSHCTEEVRYTAFRQMYFHMKCPGVLTIYDSKRPITDLLLHSLNARGVAAVRWPHAGKPWSDVSTVYLCAASIDRLRWIDHKHFLVDAFGLYKNQKLFGDEAMEYNATLRISYVHKEWQVIGTTRGWARNEE